jgi:integrase/recombinase XerD
MTFRRFLTSSCHLARLTVDAYCSDIRHFQTVVGHTNLPTRDAIIHFMTTLHHNGFTTASTRRKLSAVKLYCHYRATQSQQPMPEWDRLFTPRRALQLPRLMTTDALQNALDYTFPNHPKAARNRLIVGLLFYAGCRVSEVVHLRVQQGSDDYVTIDGKGQRQRMVPLAAPLQQRFRDYEASRTRGTSPWMFPSGSGARPISRQTVTHMIQHLTKACGIQERITPHMFRHMFATNLMEKGLDIRDIQWLLGHASIQTTQMYTHLDTRALKRTFNRYHPLS